jgi:predicted PolB exonuclease-like 3'-5' exonuclease
LGLKPLYFDKITCICAKDSDDETFSKVMTHPNYDVKDKKGLLNDEGYLLQFFLQWLSHRPHKHYFLVTKNGKIFDIPFLFIRYVLRFGYSPENDLPIIYYVHFDLQEITSKSVGLQQMAELLSCTPKSGIGKNAIKLWKEGRYDELKEYCMNDVLITEEVFLRWRKLQNGKMRRM